MKKYRRIEITAFRRRVNYYNGDSTPDVVAFQDVSINDADTEESIEAESAEGQRLLSEAVQMLEERLQNQNVPEPSGDRVIAASEPKRRKS